MTHKNGVRETAERLAKAQARGWPHSRSIHPRNWFKTKKSRKQSQAATTEENG